MNSVDQYPNFISSINLNVYCYGLSFSSETKSQIYSCLTVYLQVMKSSVDRKGFTDQMINHILKDIAIEEATIKVRIPIFNTGTSLETGMF